MTYGSKVALLGDGLAKLYPLGHSLANLGLELVLGLKHLDLALLGFHLFV